MVKALLCTIALLLITGCASTKIKTDIISPYGDIWTVKSKSDAVVEIKLPDGTLVKVDNRGKPTEDND